MKYQILAPRALFAPWAFTVGLVMWTLGCAWAQDVSFYLVAKGQAYVQKGTNAPARAAESPYGFAAITAPTPPGGTILSATVRTPSNAVYRLTEEDSGRLEYPRSFFVTNELNAQFPAGTYWLTNETASFGRQTAQLSLGAEIFPNAPQIANWTAAQSVSTNAPFVLSWLPFTSAAAVDRFIRVEIEDGSGDLAFATGWPRATNALASMATSVTIPGGRLAQGETYRGRLLFFNVTGVNTTNIPGARGMAGYYRSTEFTLTTVNPAGTVRWGAERYFTNEAAGFAELTIERVGGSSGEIMVSYYADIDGTVTMGDGFTRTAVLVEIVDDEDLEGYEPNDFFIHDVSGGANRGVPAVTVLTVVDDDSTPGPNVMNYAVAKGQEFVQTSAGGPVASPEGRYCFVASVDETFPGSATSATVRRPNAPALTLGLAREEFHERLSVKRRFSTREWLDNTFTNGDYTFSIRTPLDGTKAPVLNLPGTNFPPVPRLLNWEVTQALDTDAAVALQITPWTNPGPNDYIRLRIDGRDGFAVLDSEAEPETRISATNTSIPLPTSELYQDEVFDARLTFVRVVGRNATGYPGATGTVEYFTDTQFTLEALPPPTSAGRFRFAATRFSGLETDGGAEFSIERVGGSEGTVQVRVVAFSGGTTNYTASAGNDFVVYSEDFNFAPGETMVTPRVPLIDDAAYERDEKFRIRLQVLDTLGADEDADVGYPSVADVTIVDNELFPDFVAPMLTVTAPADGARTTTSTTTARGTAGDNVGVTLVEWCVVNRAGTTPYQPATSTNGWTNWTARTTNLYAGTNTIQIRCRDAYTNRTSISRAVFFESQQPLKLVPFGPGTLPAGWSNNIRLVVGSNYTLTAVPDSGALFSNWIGGIGVTSTVLTRKTTLSFMMATGLSLQANFVLNPFLVATGGYYGLFYPASNVQHSNSGFFQFALAGAGGYSAKLLSGGSTNMLAGKLGWDGKATNLIGSNGLTRVEWMLGLGSGFNQQITGRVVTATGESVLLGDRAPNYAPAGRSPYAGRYTATIPGDFGDAAAPGGDAALSLFVETNGWLTLAGNVADGSGLSQGVPVATNGVWPLYALANGGRGSVLAWAQFYTNAAPATNVWSERVKWTRTAVNPPASYSNGFAVERTLHGFRYASAMPALKLTNGLVEFEGPSVGGSFSNRVTLTRSNTIVNLGSNALTLTVTPSNGLYKGTVTIPSTTNKFNFNGVLLQRTTNGTGYFMRNGLGGKVSFRAAPVP